MMLRLFYYVIPKELLLF